MRNFTILIVIGLLILSSKAETQQNAHSPAVLDLSQLEDALDTYQEVIVLFEDTQNINQNQVYEDFLFEAFPKLIELYPNSLIGKVILQDTHQIPKYYKFREYPALAFFDKGKKNIYQGNLNLEKFLAWISDISLTKLITLRGQDDFNQFLKSDKNPKLVAFYTKEATDEIKILEELVKGDELKLFDIHKVGICFEDCNVAYENYKLQRTSLALFRNFEKVEPIALKRRGLDDKEDILEFCNKEALPLIVLMDELNVTKLFAGHANVQMILFVDPSVDNSKVLQDFETSALHNRKEDLYYERVLHSVFQFDDEWEEIKSFFSKYDRSKLPTVFITQITDEGIVKYEFNKEKVTFDTLRDFLDDFRMKNLQKMRISEELPNNEGKLVRKLVGKNFQKEVVLSKDNYVVLFCDKLEVQACQTSLKLFEYASEKLANVSTNETTDSAPANLNFGYIDMLKNEVEYRFFTRYPQILLYMKGKKNRPNEFDLPLTPKAFVAWLNSMLPELELTLTDAEETKFIEEKYSAAEKEEYEKLTKKLLEQKVLVETELAKNAPKEQDSKTKETPSQGKVEEVQQVLSLGGPVEPKIAKQPETPKANKETSAKKAKKAEKNTDL